jgi:hypothetical protein
MEALNAPGSYVSATQTAGNGWSGFNTIVAVNGLSLVSGFGVDSPGNATMVYESIGLSTSQALAVSGTVAANAWSAPVVLSGSDTSVSQIYFALSANGAAFQNLVVR